MPYLVFLHGLLGSQTDWQNIIANLPHFPCIALDLPFHGQSQAIEVRNFDDTAHYLSNQIKSAVGNAPYFLIGYSLGARLALYYSQQSLYEKGNLQGLILEGGNLGLNTELEKQARWENDNAWARRFEQEAIENVLHDWYLQPVFSHLSPAERKQLIQHRKSNHGKAIANMLRATSLAKQPNFREIVKQSAVPIFYICGECDTKFQALAESYQLPCITIPHAGHNTHLENPKYFSKKIENLILKIAQP